MNSMKCNITVTEVLSKESTVEIDEEDYTVEQDEDGMLSRYPKDYVDFKDLYKEQHYSILQLLNILKKECKHKLMNTQSQRKANYLKGIIEDCDGWCVDDCEIIE